MLEATPDAVILLDAAGSVLLANPAAEVVLRATVEEVRGKPAAKWLTSPAVLELLERSGEDGGTGEVAMADGRVLVRHGHRPGRAATARSRPGVRAVRHHALQEARHAQVRVRLHREP